MAYNTQLSGVVSEREYCECNIRDRLLRPSDGAEGGEAASTSCYVSRIRLAISSL